MNGVCRSASGGALPSCADDVERRLLSWLEAFPGTGQ
jgi:hypothetical protein